MPVLNFTHVRSPLGVSSTTTKHMQKCLQDWGFSMDTHLESTLPELIASGDLVSF